MNTLEHIDHVWSMYKLSGISQSMLSNMFNHNNDPYISTQDICNAFKIILFQFIADVRNLVSLKEQTEMFEKWSALISDKKTSLLRSVKKKEWKNVN